MIGQAPSVGRVVHYQSHGTPIQADGTQAFSSVCRAAIITEVYTVSDLLDDELDGHVGLCVLNPTGLFLHSLADGGCAHVEPSETAPGYGPPGGTWHWPERT